jgi:hypothetical protein
MAWPRHKAAITAPAILLGARKREWAACGQPAPGTFTKRAMLRGNTRQNDPNRDCHPGASNGILAALLRCRRFRPRVIREAVEAYTRIFML